MDEKKKFNWLIPVPICDALEPTYETLNDKQKWLVGSAALLMFIEASEEDRKQIIGKIAAANAMGNMEELVQESLNTQAVSETIPLPKPKNPPAKAARTRKKSPSGRKKKS